MTRYPLISIVTPTFNSAKTLWRTLQSLKEQTYPQNRIEILIIDGGSSDNTVEIAKEYGCKVFENPKTDIVEAERIGYLKAKGKYLVGLAPDEVYENKNSLKIKYSIFKKNEQVKCVLPSGYKTPEDYSQINHYINEFGDPFSFFMYRDSKGYKYLVRDLLAKNRLVYEDRNMVIFSFAESRDLPLIELWAGGCMIDAEFTKTNFPEVSKNPSLIALIFYLLNSKEMLLGVGKNDPTLHYSTSSVGKYLKKIRSRVEFNTFMTPMGKGGYSGREKFETGLRRIKKFLFIPYSLSVVLPAGDSLYLAVTRRKLVYLLHLPLSFFTALLIIYYRLVKVLGINHKIKLYGQ